MYDIFLVVSWLGVILIAIFMFGSMKTAMTVSLSLAVASWWLLIRALTM